MEALEFISESAGEARVDGGSGSLRTIIAIAGCVYLVWWFTVELFLPGSYNPFLGRFVVVAVDGVLLAASYRSRWVETRLSALFTLWVCLLVGHYCYLVIGNHGDSTWWVGAFVTFAATSMCLQSPREVALFSVFAMGAALYVAAALGQLRHSIYLPGLATILLLANVTKRSQRMAQAATTQAARARKERQRSDEQRLQLAAIVESSGDAIVAVGLDGRIVSWNEGAARLFGYEADEVVGKPASVLALPDRHVEEPAFPTHPRDGDHIVPFQTVRRRKDGRAVNVSVTLSPIRDARGDVVGASIAARDITDWKRAEAEAQRAREAAEMANRELEAFNYSVAHDLRAPLRAISGFSQVLLEDYSGTLDPAGQQHLRRVADAAQHMNRLIESMLSLSRVTSANLRSQWVDLSEIARTAAERLKESQPERAVEFVIAEGLKARGDSGLLGAAIENLLSNAWKFTGKRPDPRIEFGSTREDGRTAYFIRDNGAGFDMAYASKLFGLFQRLHTAGEFEGTGIGLATVQRIVQRHGGRVWADGKVGGGACFHFTLGDGIEP